MNAAGDVMCSVCVATYKRPEYLRALLASLVTQNLGDGLAMEVIVVDNDPEQGGARVVADFDDTDRVRFSYFTQPIKNISLTRNMAVAHARGSFVLFIDDDEIASPDWVRTMLGTLHAFEADAVIGRVVPLFDEQAPEWIKDIYIYHKNRQPTGTPLRVGQTSNALVRADRLTALDGPFNPDHGRTGGEDTDLFHRLALKGARLVSCYEGYVQEWIPTERTCPNWLRERALRTGMLYGRRRIDHAGRPALIKAYLFAKSALQCLASGALSMLFFADRYRRLHWQIKTAAYWGHIMSVFGQRRLGY